MYIVPIYNILHRSGKMSTRFEMPGLLRERPQGRQQRLAALETEALRLGNGGFKVPYTLW